jgi:hypothetical protein
MEEFSFAAPNEAVRAAERPAHRRAPIPGSTEFVIRLKACIDKIAATRPLCGHMDVQEDREQRQNPESIKSVA